MDFGELFNIITEHINTPGVKTSGIKAIYRIYTAIERGRSPIEKDIFSALDTLEAYYSTFLKYNDDIQDEWEAEMYKKELPVTNLWKNRLLEIRDALRSRNTDQMLIALDNAINQWHIDVHILQHLEWEFEAHPKYEEMCTLLSSIQEILTRLGKFSEEAPYIGIRD